MGRVASTFKQGDLRRAIAATLKAGVSVQRVEVGVKDGKIVVVAGKPLEPADTITDGRNDFGEVP